jgi:hypothetical protein
LRRSARRPCGQVGEACAHPATEDPVSFSGYPGLTLSLN